MTTPLEELLTEPALKLLAGKPRSQILGAPVNVLRGVDEPVREQLRQLDRIETVNDLLLRSDAVRDLPGRIKPGDLTLTPGQIDALICALLYPKHDPGPPCHWERLFEKAPLADYVNHPGNPFHTHFGPVFYRGRLDGTARVLIVGQDPSTDELIAHRILAGDAGQRLQFLLGKLGLTRSYLMLNTFLFGIFGQYQSSLGAEPAIQQYRNQLFDHAKATNKLEAVFCFGKAAHESVLAWPGLGSLPMVYFLHPSFPDDAALAQNWNQHLAPAHAAVAADHDGLVDLTPYGATIDKAPIPRFDLPFGAPAWEGTNGTSSQRQGETGILWTAP